MKGNFTCLVNPRCTREFEHDLLKADNTKNVMIIGAGPGGLMAARTAAQRGHNVTVYDKDTHFGGVNGTEPVATTIVSGLASSDTSLPILNVTPNTSHCFL